MTAKDNGWENLARTANIRKRIKSQKRIKEEFHGLTDKHSLMMSCAYASFMVIKNDNETMNKP